MKKPKRLKQRIGVVASIAFAFAFATMISPKIFVANSPEINKNFIADILNSPSNMIALLRGDKKPSNNIAQEVDLKNEIPDVPQPEGVHYNQIVEGVYASEPDENGKSFIKIDRGTKLEKKTIMLDDGSTRTVYIPVNQ